jgi:dihydrofolate reductase
MGSVIFDTSMSLDGFMAGENVRRGAGLGDDGERLHDWVFRDDIGMDLVRREVANLGAVICGRTTYDMSIEYWGPDGPTREARVPVFILAHDAPTEVPANGVYTFVDGVDAVLERARATAGDRNISVMGASTAQQLIRAGLVDQISIHLVPVLFGDGLRTFDVVDGHIALEIMEVQHRPLATHLRYRVIRDA